MTAALPRRYRAALARLLVAVVAAALIPATSGLAQDPEQPKITEETPFVITPTIVVDTMLQMAGVRATDFLIDLGSGDGRIVIEAAKRFGARGFGVDYDPRLVKRARENAEKAGVSDRVIFLEQNLFNTDITPASVITMYLLPEYMLALRPKLFELKAGTRLVSHDYDMGEWEPDSKVKIPVPDKPVGADKASTILFWIVPAKVKGTWKTTVPGMKGWTEAEIRFEQKFQKISGEAVIEGRHLPLSRASLTGDHISFRVEDGDRTIRFDGQALTARMQGQVAVSGGRAYRWRALRSDDRGGA
jgi:hypothetical protein